jgi:DNA-binding transcriptional LysR family regulator
VSLEIRSHSSAEIGQLLDNHELDAGITYLDNEPLGAVRTTEIYHERYVFLTAAGPAARSSIRWHQLRDEPLCLLTPDMQNRRIVDAAFAQAGVVVTPRVAVNSITAMLAFAKRGRLCAMADTWLALHGMPAGMRALRLTAPDPTHTIGLVTLATMPEQPLVHALTETLRAGRAEQHLTQLITNALEHAT